MPRYEHNAGRGWMTLVTAICLCMVLTVFMSCGKDDNPVTPTNNLPNDEGLPAIPTLASPNAELPARSDTRSLAKPIDNFAPRISSAFADWYVRGYGVYEEWPTWINCDGGWKDLCGEDGGNVTVEDWNDELPVATGCFGACGLVVPYCPSSFTVKFDEFPNTARIVLMYDGQIQQLPNPIKWSVTGDSFCRRTEIIWGCVSKAWIVSEYNVTGKPIGKRPYIRRDRFWEPQQWESGSFVYQMTGDNEVWEKSEYTWGTSVEQIESFAWSLGASVGAEYKGLQAQINGSITKTFTEAFTARSDTTKSVDKHLKGDAGKITCHVLWSLVERFTFVDKDGNDYTDPNYVFHPGYPDGVTQDLYYDFEMKGTREHLAKYVFDNTGALLEMSIVE